MSKITSKVNKDSDAQIANDASKFALAFLKNLAIASMSAQEQKTFWEEAKKPNSKVDDQLFSKYMKKKFDEINTDGVEGIDSAEMSKFLTKKGNAEYFRKLEKGGFLGQGSYTKLLNKMQQINKICLENQAHVEKYNKQNPDNKYVPYPRYFDMVTFSKGKYNSTSQDDGFMLCHAVKAG